MAIQQISSKSDELSTIHVSIQIDIFYKHFSDPGVCHLVRCLESENVDLLRSTSGVLVNLMADWDKRLALKEYNGIPKLISVLAKYGEGDWRLAGLICQVLWNFSIDSTHLYAAFGVESTNGLLTVLLDLLDEEKLFGVGEGCEVKESVAESEEYLQWEQFANVATDLLEKIELYLETLEELGAEV